VDELSEELEDLIMEEEVEPVVKKGCISIILFQLSVELHHA
jgi:hypothetical protein